MMLLVYLYDMGGCRRQWMQFRPPLSTTHKKLRLQLVRYKKVLKAESGLKGIAEIKLRSRAQLDIVIADLSLKSERDD